MGDLVRLVSVNVARPAYLGMHRGQPVESGIAKRPVEADSLWLDWTNLEGDGQADLEVHGGPEKAVYAYPSEHLPVWSEELGQDLGPAAFGENLTTAGWLEHDACIGDRWAWGDAVLEICQPRWPCYKVGLYRGNNKVMPRLRGTGRTGWYLRVLQTGRVPVALPVTITVERHPSGITVTDVHEARLHGAGPDRLAEMVDLEPLARGWRASLAEMYLASQPE
ncbi:MAG: MOSC domain-containing protein [Acidimicrobiales bacterium]